MHGSVGKFRKLQNSDKGRTRIDGRVFLNQVAKIVVLDVNNSCAKY